MKSICFVRIAHMDQSGLTSEFGICLLPDSKTKRAVDTIRQTLPASPYRDDTPHLTLLRTIKSPTQISDAELLQNMEELLELSRNLPLAAIVRKPVNGFSPLFGFSSVVLLRASPEMKSYRKNIVRILKANDYYSSRLESLLFFPHLSIRLGVSYTDKTKVMAAQSFETETKITFSKWVIFRDIKQDGKRLIKQISLSD